MFLHYPCQPMFQFLNSRPILSRACYKITCSQCFINTDFSEEHRFQKIIKRYSSFLNNVFNYKFLVYVIKIKKLLFQLDAIATDQFHSRCYFQAMEVKINAYITLAGGVFYLKAKFPYLLHLWQDFLHALWLVFCEKKRQWVDHTQSLHFLSHPGTHTTVGRFLLKSKLIWIRWLPCCPDTSSFDLLEHISEMGQNVHKVAGSIQKSSCLLSYSKKCTVFIQPQVQQSQVTVHLLRVTKSLDQFNKCKRILRHCLLNLI